MNGCLRISILETGKLPKQLEEKFGSYPRMFSNLFKEIGIKHVLEIFDLTTEKLPKNLENTDLWLITGSAYGVYEKIEWISKLKQLINQIYLKKTPLLGICFGHQIIAEVLGGKVTKSEKGWGVGVHEYQRISNPKWSNDIGDFFSGYTSHQDQIIVKPKNAFTIFGSNFCPYSILCYDDIENPNVITIQSHPEFKRDCLKMIINRRLGKTIPADVGIKGIKSLNYVTNNRIVFSTLLKGLKVI